MACSRLSRRTSACGIHHIAFEVKGMDGRIRLLGEHNILFLKKGVTWSGSLLAPFPRMEKPDSPSVNSLDF